MTAISTMFYSNAISSSCFVLSFLLRLLTPSILAKSTLATAPGDSTDASGIGSFESLYADLSHRGGTTAASPFSSSASAGAENASASNHRLPLCDYFQIQRSDYPFFPPLRRRQTKRKPFSLLPRTALTTAAGSVWASLALFAC